MCVSRKHALDNYSGILLEISILLRVNVSSTLVRRHHSYEVWPHAIRFTIELSLHRFSCLSCWPNRQTRYRPHLSCHKYFFYWTWNSIFVYFFIIFRNLCLHCKHFRLLVEYSFWEREQLTLNASRNLWLIMLYSKGLMHVDMKYKTPETYVRTV